eukprot:gene4102-745_t
MDGPSRAGLAPRAMLAIGTVLVGGLAAAVWHAASSVPAASS